jgi:hypothetical protein
MAKSEFLYWGYGEEEGHYNDSASVAASVSQFAYCYYFLIITAFIFFPWQVALINILKFVIIHWCGGEDLGYFITSIWIRLPQKYLDTHPTIKIGKINTPIPVSLYWLAKPRVVFGITIPSVIGIVCGEEVQGIPFVIFSGSIIMVIAILTIFGL